MMILTRWEKVEMEQHLVAKLDGLPAMVELDGLCRDIWIDEIRRTEALLAKVRSAEIVETE